MNLKKIKDGVPSSIANDPRGYVVLNCDYKLGSIIDKAQAQVTDGIGEGDSRACRLFVYHYERILDATMKDVDGKLAVKFLGCDPQDIVRCIWTVCRFEREDNGWAENDKNHFYQYLDADWHDICKLNAVLNKVTPEQLEEAWKSTNISDSCPFEQAAMNVLVKGKSFIKGHNVTKEADKLFVDGKEVAMIPEELPKAIDVLLKELKKLDDKITDSQVTDAFENIKKHFAGAKQFSLAELKKSGYNKMDDGKYVGLQLYSPWAKENMEKVVNTLYNQFSKQHNYNTSPKNTRKWIQEMVENNIEANPEGAFLIQFGVIDGWVEKLKELVTSQIQVEHLDKDEDPANRGNETLE